MNKKDKIIITILLIIIAILSTTLVFIIKEQQKNNKNTTIQNTTIHKDITYKYEIDNDTSNIDNYNALKNNTTGVFKTYQEYEKFMDNNSLKKEIDKESFDKYNYLYCALFYDCGTEIYGINDIKIDKGNINVSFKGRNTCKCCMNPQVYILAVDKDTKINNIEISYLFN